MSKFLDEQGLALVSQQIFAKQDELVSGENIKTINGESILQNGDLPMLEIINIPRFPYTVDKTTAAKLKNGTAVIKIDYSTSSSLYYCSGKGNSGGHYYYNFSSVGSSWYIATNNSAITVYKDGNAYSVQLNDDTNELTLVSGIQGRSVMNKGQHAYVRNNSSHNITVSASVGLDNQPSALFKTYTIAPGATLPYDSGRDILEIYLGVTTEVVTISSGSPISTGPNRWGLVDTTTFVITDAETSEGSDTPVGGGTQLYSHDVTISGVLSSEPVTMRIVAITNVPSLDASQDWSLSILTNTIRFYNMSDNYSEDCVTFSFTAPATITQSLKNGQSATINFDEPLTITDTVTVL